MMRILQGYTRYRACKVCAYHSTELLEAAAQSGKS